MGRSPKTQTTSKNNLVSALTRGELPVNLQPVTQIFDHAIASIPPTLNLQQDRFIELYNDLPHLFTAYAIDVTLSEDSYHRQNNEIIFHRFARGNYWIVPIQAAPEQGWLVPNPLKGLALDRMQSLDTSFDRDIVPNHSNNNCILVAPALVQILPIVEPLTWKLLERGKLTNSQTPKLSTPTAVIESLVEKLVKLNDRIFQLERELVNNAATSTSTDKQSQLQSIVTKIVKHLEIKQQEISSLTNQLAEFSDRSNRQDREIAELKVQIGSIETSIIRNIVPVADPKEIVSLKVELERLKADYQSYQRQQDKSQWDLIANMKLLIAQEIDKIQLDPEAIDGKIIALDSTLPHENLSPKIGIRPTEDKSRSPFGRLYNSGEKAFLRSYIVSTAIEDISNFLQLSDRIATAGQPTIDQYSAIAIAGYQIVINLALKDSPSALADEFAIASNLGLEYIQLPAIWTEPTLADFQAFMNIMDKYSAQKVFVHCAANKRVSAFLYLYRQLAEGVDESIVYQDLVKIWTSDSDLAGLHRPD